MDETPSERAACWFFHKWSRWTLETEEDRQQRVCLGCGKHQLRSLGPKEKTHTQHTWKETERERMYIAGPDGKQAPIGYVIYLTCAVCGEVAARKFNMRELP